MIDPCLDLRELFQFGVFIVLPRLQEFHFGANRSPCPCNILLNRMTQQPRFGRYIPIADQQGIAELLEQLIGVAFDQQEIVQNLMGKGQSLNVVIALLNAPGSQH